MSRRQALGVLTNQTNQIQQRQTLVTKQVVQHKDATSETIFASSTTTKAVQNDENLIQNALKQQQQQQIKNFDFEIYQDSAGCGGGGDDFQIFCDSTTSVHQKNNNNNSKKPLQPLPLHINLLDLADSPMMLDDTIKFQHTGISEDDCIDDEEDLKRLQVEERELELQNCEEYARDIVKHLKELELVNRAKSTYIKQQQDITSSMRSILVDWLVEVCEEYKLHTETLYLAVNYTDRFLSKMSVLRGKLQLLGTASIYIASKYEEIFPPDVNEFVYITDDTYTKQQVLRMEHLILKVLDFHMNAPTANCFLLHFIQYTKCSKRIEHLARYIAELTLVEAEPFLEFTPSQIATSSLYLAMLTLKSKEWDMFDLTGYTLSDVRPCIGEVYKAWCNAPEHPQQAIQEKYKNERFDSVASIEPPKFLHF